MGFATFGGFYGSSFDGWSKGMVDGLKLLIGEELVGVWWLPVAVIDGGGSGCFGWATLWANWFWAHFVFGLLLVVFGLGGFWSTTFMCVDVLGLYDPFADLSSLDQGQFSLTWLLPFNHASM